MTRRDKFKGLLYIFKTHKTYRKNGTQVDPANTAYGRRKAAEENVKRIAELNKPTKKSKSK